MGVFALVILCGALVAAQQTTPTTTPTTTAPTTLPPTGGGTNTGPVTTQPTQPQQSQTPRLPPTPIFITGTVALPDGTEPPDRVLIERLCLTNSVRSEGFTDSKGRFSIQLGQSLQLVGDASEVMLQDGTQGFSSNSRNSAGGQPATDPYMGCELRARLAGYRSSTLLLAGRRAMDNPYVGVLTIFPILKTDGQAMTATSATASKDARKAFEKGVSEAKKQKLDTAEKEFRRAAALHPKYAEAWLALGKMLVDAKRLPEAREALEKAIAADPQYVYPYEQMYLVAFQEEQWQELANTTERLLRLNPYEFPAAYYYNGVANYQLKNYDAAQKSLEQAIGADRRNANPKTHYVMGLVMVAKKDLRANDAAIPKVQSILEQIELALR
jgi:tetratricopeptide (TPR) repeat protein